MPQRSARAMPTLSAREAVDMENSLREGSTSLASNVKAFTYTAPPSNPAQQHLDMDDMPGTNLPHSTRSAPHSCVMPLTFLINDQDSGAYWRLSDGRVDEPLDLTLAISEPSHTGLLTLILCQGGAHDQRVM